MFLSGLVFCCLLCGRRVLLFFLFAFFSFLSVVLSGGGLRCLTCAVGGRWRWSFGILRSGGSGLASKTDSWINEVLDFMGLKQQCVRCGWWLEKKVLVQRVSPKAKRISWACSDVGSCCWNKERNDGRRKGYREWVLSRERQRKEAFFPRP